MESSAGPAWCGDRGDTCLHLAVRLGFVNIAEYLIEQGHDEEFISRNNEWETPLMVAAMTGKEDMGVMLAKRFPHCIPMQDKQGMDALMHATATNHGTLQLIPTLLAVCPSIISAIDNNGNTALHYASAAGELKALRILLEHGADPLAQNYAQWMPVHYSASTQAEIYFKNLIIEFSKMKAENARVEKEMERRRGAGVRLVTNTGEDAAGGVIDLDGPAGSGAASRGESEASTVRQRARDDAALAGLPAPGMSWSPIVDKRRAMTPTETRREWLGGNGVSGTPTDEARPRAGSGN